MKILVIDDDAGIRHSLKLKLSKINGAEVLAVRTGEEGITLLQNHDIAIAFIDIQLPGIDGMEVLQKIISSKIPTFAIMITYMNEAKLAVKAMKIGACDYLTKPFSMDEVFALVLNVIKYREKRLSFELQRDEKQLFVGSSEQIRSIKATMGRIASSNYNTNILIQGESGTGKEVVANYLHQSFQEEKPFVAINCAAIPKSLQESELFGYEKGSFTEAKGRKNGLLEMAHHGILFLDEVGDMDLDLQAKLLRVLENKKFRRVGGTNELDFDALVVAATNKNLQADIKNGRFRMDLYYRLNIIPIYIKPLRERKEDIPLLLEYFIGFFRARMNSTIVGISDEAMKLLMNYEWQGNIRELKNMIERIMILSNKTYIETEDLPQEIFGDSKSAFPQKYGSNLKDSEKKVIAECLQKNHCNISRTADELGITRTTLRSKMQRYNIKKD